MNKNTNTVKKTGQTGLESVANQDWPALQSISRFQIERNKKPMDIEKVVSSIKEVTDEDEALISGAGKVAKTPIRRKKGSTEQTAAPIVSQGNAQEVSEEEIEQEIRKMEEAAVTPVVSSVTPQTTKQAVASPTQQASGLKQAPVVNTSSNTTGSTNAVLKFVAKGFAHLYVKKTNEILSPLRFIMNNHRVVGLAFWNMIIPALMTWYAINHLTVISNQVAGEGLAMKTIYYAVFYIASIVVWVTLQALFSGVKSTAKDQLKKVEDVGKQVK